MSSVSDLAQEWRSCLAGVVLGLMIGVAVALAWATARSRIDACPDACPTGWRELVQPIGHACKNCIRVYRAGGVE